jgi:hypothetical protein
LITFNRIPKYNFIIFIYQLTKTEFSRSSFQRNSHWQLGWKAVFRKQLIFSKQ